MIFKMLALEQLAEKWPFSAGGGGRPTALTPLGYGPVMSWVKLGFTYLVGYGDGHRFNFYWALYKLLVVLVVQIKAFNQIALVFAVQLHA